MQDRELLELAAKAAGYALVWSSVEGIPPRKADDMETWNPLADDGDALRLACQLQFDLVLGHRGATVSLPGKKLIEELCHQDSGENLACTRRCIVRAAAEIGRAMK